MGNPFDDVKMREISFDIDGHSSYQIVGETFYGEDVVLLKGDDNLIASTPWAKQGFTVAPFLKPPVHERLVAGIRALVMDVVRSVVDIPESFQLEQFHKYISNDQLHEKLVPRLRDGFPFDKLPIPLRELESHVSGICGVDLTATNPSHHWQAFYVRIVRPGKGDNNPPHRDVWLDFYRHCVNIYVPLAGSDERSSLPLVSGSHLWAESEIERTRSGAKIRGFTYRVPSVTGSKRPMRFVRPNPSFNELMVFSPYLIHGGGTNLNSDQTRMSLEMRFFRKKQIP